MKLTQIQIQELYAFTRKHFVEHYDLQTELVDHLANDIEIMWSETPKLSFEEAKQKAFKKFGVFGFMEAIEQKQKAMSKRYMKILWQYAKEWFTLPKILITITTVVLFQFLLTVRYGYNAFMIILLGLIIVEYIHLYRLRKTVKKRFKANKKKWMLEDIIFSIASANNIFFGVNFFNLLHLAPTREVSQLGAYFIAIVFVLAIIYSYVSLIVIPSKAEKLLEDTYPEYKMVA